MLSTNASEIVVGLTCKKPYLVQVWFDAAVLTNGDGNTQYQGKVFLDSYFLRLICFDSEMV